MQPFFIKNFQMEVANAGYINISFHIFKRFFGCKQIIKSIEIGTEDCTEVFDETKEFFFDNLAVRNKDILNTIKYQFRKPSNSIL